MWGDNMFGTNYGYGNVNPNMGTAPYAGGFTAGDTSNVAFSAIVNVNPSCRCTDNTTVLQLQVLDVNVTVENAVVTVVKCNG